MNLDIRQVCALFAEIGNHPDVPLDVRHRAKLMDEDLCKVIQGEIQLHIPTHEGDIPDDPPPFAE